MEAVLATYILHSSLLLAAACLALRLLSGTAGRVWILRAALLGGTVTTAAALALGLGTPLRAPWATQSIELEPLAMHIQPVPGSLAGSVTGGAALPSEAGKQAPAEKPAAPLSLPSWPWLVLGASAALAGRLAWRDLRSRRALAGAQPLDRDLVSAPLRPLLGNARLRVAPGLTSPLALGTSTIVLPERLLDAPQGEVDAVVAHELAHLVRRDPQWLGLGRAMVQVAWFQPGLRWALGALERESELAADAWAIERTGRPLDLALALERVARWVVAAPAPVLAAAMTQRSGIVDRVERLTQAPQGARLKPAGWTAAAAGLALAVVACTGPSVQEPHPGSGEQPVQEPILAEPMPADSVVRATILSAREAPDAPARARTVRIDVVEPGNKLDVATGEPYSGEGRYRYDSARVLDYSVGGLRVADLDELRAEMEVLYGVDPAAGMRLQPGSGVVYGDVVPVLDACIRAGFTDIAFVDQSSDQAREWTQLYGQDSRPGGDLAPIQYLPYDGEDAEDGEARAVITLDEDGHWIGSPGTPEANADLLRGLAQEMRRGQVETAPFAMELALDRLLIRADPDSPFGAVRDLIQTCASQDIGIWRIEIAPSDDTAEAIVPVFLPLDLSHGLPSEIWTYETQPDDTFAEVYPLVQRQVEAGNVVTFVGGY